MTEELLLPTTLGGTGLGLLVFGLILTYYLKIHGGMMAYRDAYADNLEKEGEIKRAEKVRRETKHIVERVPIYGKTMLVIGGILMIASLFTL